MPHKDKTILIADDDELICDLLTFVLEGEGYKILTAHTAETIINKIQTMHPDLTLLDLTLGDKSGTEVLKAIDGSEMPVIMLSGYDAKYIEESGIKKYSCVKGFLMKPVSPETVAAEVKKALA